MKNGIVIPDPTADSMSPPSTTQARLGKRGTNPVTLTSEVSALPGHRATVDRSGIPEKGSRNRTGRSPAELSGPIPCGHSVGRIRVEVVAVSRRVQTLLFTDIVGSTDRLRTVGDAAWASVLVRHHGVIRALLAAHGGWEVDTAGDGFLARFDSPASAVRAAAAAILALVPLEIEIRAGLHTGEVELDEGRVAGVGVHVAARVMAEAGGGQVLVSSTVRDLMAGSGFGFLDLGLRGLKGFSEPWRLFALDLASVQGDSQTGRLVSEAVQQGEGGTVASSPALLSVGRWGGFVGHEELLERSLPLGELGGLLAATAAGGRVALVAGEAGIGKSALVRRFAKRHAADARFLVGSCDPLLTPRALGPLHDIARQTGGRLAELLASGGPREVVFAAFLDELVQPPGHQVVVVEDAHWADEATLDLLVFLGRRLERSRALLIVTYRDDELDADHPLRGVLGVLPHGVVHRLQLGPLSGAAVGELARRAGRPAAALHEVTGGNPLLVTEVLAAGDADVPLTIHDLVLARLAGLPGDTQAVVRLVAVVPTRAELWLLDEVLGPEPSWVERGVTAGLLVMDGEAVGFRHELLRLAVEGSLSLLARRELHRRVLRVLSDARGRGVDVARLVHHARQADDTDAVLRYAPEAARQAAAVAAHREAVGHYRAALAYADRLSPAVRAELLEAHSFQAYLSGLFAEAVSARQAALSLREAAGDEEQVGEGLRWLSRLHWWAGNRQEAQAAAARAIAVLERGPPGHQLAMAYSNQAQLDMLAYRTEAALAWASRAIELARRLDDPETLTHALTNIGSTRLVSGDLGGRVELEQAFELAINAGLEDHAARALVNLAGCAVEMRDYRHARDDLDRALAFVQAHDLAGYAQHLLGYRARLRLDLGDWAGADHDARAALAEREQLPTGPMAVDALTTLGLLQARRGEPEATATLQEAAAHALPSGELQWIGLVAAARAEHAWLGGELDRTATEAAIGFELAVQAGHPWFAGELASWLWRAGALAEVPTFAAEPYRLLLGGDWQAAADAWQALSCSYEQAQALAHGDTAACRQALGLLDGLGAVQAARRLRHQLRARGAPG